MVFPNADEANAAREKLKGGLSFEDLAKERGISASDYDLGVVAKNGIIDSAVADAVFALPENDVSEPIQGRFGVVLAKVSKIEPGVEPNYDAVSGVIKSQMALERARAAIQDLHNKMEDERGGGASVMDAAQKAGLTPVMVEAIDRSGRDPSGAPVATLPKDSDVISSAFASDVGTDNDPIRTKTGGYIWYDVLGITPARDRAIDEVKDQVATRWREDQIASKLKAKADELLDQLTKAGKMLAEVSETVGLKPETAAAFKRNANIANLGSNAVDGAFRLSKGQSARTSGDQPNEWIVYTLTDVSTPAFDPASAEAKTLRDTIERQQSEEQVAQYIAKRESEIGVKVNEQAFAIATGAAQADANN
jgi:peptidyl-prolyl cis-trans isomerase D